MILYDFVKIPQSFFCSKKTTAPFTREPLTAGASPVLRYTIHTKQKGFLIKGSLCNFQNNAIEIKSDYINYNTYLIPRRTWDTS